MGSAIRKRISPPSLEELRARREEILGLASTRGAHNVRVLGSVVRGEAHADSDIDFLVDFVSGTGLFTWGSLIADLEELLGSSVHVVTVPSLKERMRDRILAEAVPL